MEDSQLSHKMTRFGQENHNILTLQTQKASLSSFNDKRWISRTETNEWLHHSFGHKDIKQLNAIDILLTELDESDESDEEETNYCIPFKKESKKRKNRIRSSKTNKKRKNKL